MSTATTCRACSATLTPPPGRRGRPAKFCSDSCRRTTRARDARIRSAIGTTGRVHVLAILAARQLGITSPSGSLLEAEQLARSGPARPSLLRTPPETPAELESALAELVALIGHANLNAWTLHLADLVAAAGPLRVAGYSYRDRAWVETEADAWVREADAGSLEPFTCWCGQPGPHDWPGKATGAAHPRAGQPAGARLDAGPFPRLLT